MSDSKSRQVPDDSYSSAYYERLGFGDDCSNSWSHYLQMLNGVCAAGAHVAANLRGLLNKFGTNLSTKDFPGISEWDAVTNALLEATLTVHSQTSPIIKYFNSPMKEHHTMDPTYQQKVIENIISIINLQYRFCMTSCKQLNMVVDSKRSKYTGDPYDVETTNIFSQIHNSNIPSPNQSEDVAVQNSFSPLYLLKSDSFQVFRNISKGNSEKPTDHKENPTLFFPSHRLENFACDKRDENNANTKEQYRPVQDTKYNQVLQKCPPYNDSKFPLSQNGKFFHLSNLTANLKSPRNLPYKFKDIRSNKNDAAWWNSQSALLSENIGPDTPAIYFELPPTPGMSRQIQSAQLRRWSETAAHATSERNDDPGNVRRWSVPWDGGQPILTENTSQWNDKYNSRDKNWIEERDSLDTAILLLSFRSHKGSANPENTSKRQCSTENQSSMRSYSIWSGSGTSPFSQLSETLEQ